MPLNFEKNAAKGNEILKEIAFELGEPENKKKAGHVLKSVLHALRDRLPAEESMQFLSQLPMALKAVYADGWTLKKKERIKHLADFIEEIMMQNGNAALINYTDDKTAKHMVRCVFHVLQKYVASGEWSDIQAVLPKELKNFLKESGEQSVKIISE